MQGIPKASAGESIPSLFDINRPEWQAYHESSQPMYQLIKGEGAPIQLQCPSWPMIGMPTTSWRK